MSEQNLEQRVQQLEQRVLLLESLFASVVKKGIEAQKLDGLIARLALRVEDRVRDLTGVILDLNPDLKTNKIVGLLHTARTQAEFTSDGVDRALADTEEILKKYFPVSPATQPNTGHESGK